MPDVTVTLEPKVEQRLRELAAAEGRTLEAYLADLATRRAKSRPVPISVAEGGYDILTEGMRRWTERTPEQVMIDREALISTGRRGRPLPEGKTLSDVVEGTWPGDETDEEIRIILEELS